MPMTENARKAALALHQLGVSVIPIDHNPASQLDSTPDGRAFVIPARDREGFQSFADYSLQVIKEIIVEGEYINPHGIREDIHRILAIYDLSTEWINPGQIMVYDAPNSENGNLVRHSQIGVKFARGHPRRMSR